jgi:hypothetical protein
MKQVEFAAVLDVTKRTVQRWESGAPIGDTGQTSLSTLLAQAPSNVATRFDYLRESSEDDVKRREALAGAVAGAGALASLGLGNAAARADQLMAGARPDAAAVELMRSTLWQAMRLDDAMGSRAAMGMVAAQQQVTEAMLRSCTESLRGQLLSLHGEWTAFAGCLAWDCGDHTTASRLYHAAHGYAHDAADDDLAAYVLCHLSQLAVWEGRGRIAVDHATAARSWAAQTSDHRLRAYVSMRAAHAAAVIGMRKPCMDALDEAADQLEIAHIAEPVGPPESRAYFVSAPLLIAFRGECLSLLGDHAAAVVATGNAVQAMPETVPRDRGITLLELARAHVRTNDVDAAADAIGDAAALAGTNRSPRLASAIVAERHHLSPWVGTRAVKELDARLAEHAIVRA